MVPFLTLIQSSPYVELPQGLGGWAGFLILLSINVILLLQWRRYNLPFRTRQVAWFILLLLLTVIFSLFFGVRQSDRLAMPPPGVPVEPDIPAIMPLAAAPWVLAAGLLGPLPAALLAFLSGFLQALFDIHTVFNPLKLSLLAVLFSAALRQNYRTTMFKILRHPFGVSILLGLFFPLLYLAITPFTTYGELVTRLDYAISNLQNISLAIGLQLLTGGLIAEGVRLASPGFWPSPGALQPSPAEKSLLTRFIISMAPLAGILILTLMVGDWIVAGQAAREMLHSSMSNIAQTSVAYIPYFLETGQNLILQIAQDSELHSDDPAFLEKSLEKAMRKVPFFNQLTLLDSNSQVLASYPTSYYVGPQAPVEEQIGIKYALDGLPFQTFTIPPSPRQNAAQVSFVAAVFSENGEVSGVLIGRSDLGSNPFTQPMLAGLNTLADISGQGMLLDENNRILVHSDPTLIMTTYTGQIAGEPIFYDGAAPDGSRQLIYYQPAPGRPWSIVLTVPAYRAQQLALTIAAPLLGMILILSIVAIIILRFGLRMVTASLQNLADEAGRLSKGQLDQPLTVEGEDEVAQLRQAFEHMRVNLKASMDELNRLLVVSQGVASSLEMSEAVQPVLQAALASGADSARVILTPTVIPEIDHGSTQPMNFGLGPSANLYGDLDEQVLAITRQQERLVLSNLLRPRLLTIPPGAPRPEALMAVALRHESQYYGALWVAYNQPHTFTEEEVRFLVTLGGQAALAAANATLFLNAEIGRQRLAAILASSPDPVLVTDQHDRMLLANPAAWHALDLGTVDYEGKPIEEVLDQPELLDLLCAINAERLSKEITLTDGRIYLATATPVMAEGQRMGRVCVLRDVTHFKELDALKSDFVATVSHDLRSPLTLMRGYATMLDMVGQLNEQQANYVRKIVTGVESMSRLVNNLLDLGRIEAGIGLQLEMIPVHDVIERVIGALQIQAAQKQIQLTSQVTPQTTPLIEADQALLQQALHNLVENAIRYTRAGGKVHVQVQSQPTGIVFSVQDTGIGISPMDMPRLFEKFYRGAHQMSKEQRGTGLGLAIVKSIAERHGGRVWAESQLGKGSIFHLSIPLQQPRRADRSR